jgi:hypothetical protein
LQATLQLVGFALSTASGELSADYGTLLRERDGRRAVEARPLGVVHDVRLRSTSGNVTLREQR